MSTATLSVGVRVRVLSEIGRVSVVREVRTGSNGLLLYVLADGGWMSASEVEPAA